MLNISISSTKVNGRPKGRPCPRFGRKPLHAIPDPFKQNIKERLRGISSAYSKVWRVSTGYRPEAPLFQRDLVA